MKRPARRFGWLPLLAALAAGPALAGEAQQQANALAADALAKGSFETTCPTTPGPGPALQLASVANLAPMMAICNYTIVRCKFTGPAPEKFEPALQAAGLIYVPVATAPAKLTYTGSTSTIHRGNAAYTKHCNPYAGGYCAMADNTNRRLTRPSTNMPVR